MPITPSEKLLISLLAILLATVLGNRSLEAAPGRPVTPAPRGCQWAGVHYAHGSLRYAPVTVAGTAQHIDIYRCQDGAWVYVGSSDDVMP